MAKSMKLPNIGEVLEKKLLLIGVDSKEKLIEIGSKDAFIKILLHDSSACLSSLYALEGAVQGIRWHNLSDDVKTTLKAFYDNL